MLLHLSVMSRNARREAISFRERESNSALSRSMSSSRAVQGRHQVSEKPKKKEMLFIIVIDQQVRMHLSRTLWPNEVDQRLHWIAR